MLSLFSRWRRALLSLLMVGLILVGLSACSVSDRPSRGVLLSALGQQIQLTQTAIAQSLDLQASGVPEVSRVRIEEQESLRIGDQKGVHLTGRFDWRLPGDAVKVDSPSSCFWNGGTAAKAGDWLFPVVLMTAVQTWITYPLAIDPA